MEGSVYWVILALLYLFSLWLKKRQQRARAAAEQQDSGEAPGPKPAGGDFLKKLLRESGFDLAEEPEPEEWETADTFPEEQAAAAEEDDLPLRKPDVRDRGAERKLQTLRERLAAFESEDETTILPAATGEGPPGDMLLSELIDGYRQEQEAAPLDLNLEDLDGWRRAVVLREILDQPRARRRFHRR